MSETKFPKPVIDDGLFYSELYKMQEVDDWFKRCMEDFPETEPIPDWWTSRFTNWFEKWFSQFKVKKNENQM